MLLAAACVLLSCLIVVCLVFILICRRRPPRKIEIITAQRSYIIKKKIILETPTFDSSSNGSNTERNFEKNIGFHLLAPLVKIDSKTVQVDLNAEELSKCGGTMYELPLDPQWEMERKK